MSTDRELMALAAKAAGKTRAEWDYDWLMSRGEEIARDMLWSPLQNSGQALDLAVRLHLLIDVDETNVMVLTEGPGEEGIINETTDGALDPCAATRRAIVRASAEIGRGMP